MFPLYSYLCHWMDVIQILLKYYIFLLSLGGYAIHTDFNVFLIIKLLLTHLHLSLIDLPSASPTVESATEAFALQSQPAASSIDTALCSVADAASAINDGPASRAAQPACT